MQLLVLAILVAVVGAGQIKVGDDSSDDGAEQINIGDGSSDIGALQMKVGDDSSDSNVEVHVIKWEVRQTDQNEPPTELHIEPEPTSPPIRNPSRQQKRPKRPRKHRTKRPKHVRMRMPKKSRTTTPETTTQRTTRKTRAKPRRRGKTTTDDWISHMKNSYKVFKNAKSFDDAEKRCKRNGAHLVSIHSELENQFVHSLTTTGHNIRSFEDFVYIGLRKDKRTGKWYWTDGSKVNYTKWAVHQPDSPETKHCTQLHQDPGPGLIYVENWKWNSISCDTRMKYFVCKR